MSVRLWMVLCALCLGGCVAPAERERPPLELGAVLAEDDLVELSQRPSEESCRELEAALESCTIGHGRRLEECLEAHGGAQARALLGACCGGGEYLQCAAAATRPVGLGVPLLERSGRQLLSLNNDLLLAAGLEPLPDSVQIVGDELGWSDVDRWSSVVEALGELAGLELSLFSGGVPSDFVGRRADGSEVELCFSGAAGEVPEAIAQLTGSLFSERLRLLGYRQGEVSQLGEGVPAAFAEQRFPVEWTALELAEGAILVVTDATRGAEPPRADAIGPCP